jgi:hypothetical protein
MAARHDEIAGLNPIHRSELDAQAKPRIPGLGFVQSPVSTGCVAPKYRIFLQRLAHPFEHRPLVPPSLDQPIAHVAIGGGGPPEEDQTS